MWTLLKEQATLLQCRDGTLVEKMEPPKLNATAPKTKLRSKPGLYHLLQSKRRAMWSSPRSKVAPPVGPPAHRLLIKFISRCNSETSSCNRRRTPQRRE